VTTGGFTELSRLGNDITGGVKRGGGAGGVGVGNVCSDAIGESAVD